MLHRLRRRLNRLARQIETASAALPSRAASARLPFGGDWMRRYLPHYAVYDPADFHTEVFDRLAALHLRRDSKEAVIAPRDGAKSTLYTLGYVLYCALERHEPYSLILSDSAGQAVEKLADIRREIESNPAMAHDYPHATGVGPCWRQDRIELCNGAVIQAIGTGGRIRGRKARQARPSLIVFDDVENNTTITSEAKREAAWRWATREVIPAGTSGTNFISVGSALHPECVAVRLGSLAGWKGYTYPAVHRWPTRMDLWVEWERLATNLADRQRDQTARAFYDTHRTEMDAGAQVYWPQRWPLLELMARRAEVGETAFDTEWQGIPSLSGVSVWPPQLFQDLSAHPFWFDQWPADLVVKVVALDPSKGGLTGDYQAHVMLGLGRDGLFYLDCELHREHPERMVERTLRLARQWGATGRQVDAILFEDNATMGLLEGAIQTTPGAGTLPWSVVTQVAGEDKDHRIMRASPYLHRRQIRVRSTSGGRLLVKQWQAFPGGDHDDGPDAVATAIKWLEWYANPVRAA